MEHVSDIIEEMDPVEDYPISTGFKFLDTVIGGYYPGEMTTICGEEDCGKSAYVISQLSHIAVDGHVPTLLVLNNMSKRTFLSCMAAYYCSIETYNVNTVLSSEKHQAAVKEFLEKLKDAPLYVIYEWNISEENFITAIEEFVQKHDIKIVFIDESNGSFEYSSTKRIKVNSLKLLALKMNIPVVATTCIWNDREGMEGMKPFLQDLYFCSEVHGHDTVIGLIKYDRHYVYEDDNGRDLHNTIHLEILKKRGLFKKRKFLIPTGYFYFKDYAEKEKKALEEIRKATDYQIDTLIKKFDLTLEHDEILPF